MKNLFYPFSLFLFSSQVIFSLEISLRSPHVLLINAKSGVTIYEKNANEKIYPASLTKIATALYVLEKKVPLDTPITATPTALQHVSSVQKERSEYTTTPYLLEADGSDYFLQKGETLSLISLLYGILLPSGNDAANVVAEFVGGNIENFMLDVNAYLKSIGCQNTSFYNPHGLHYPDHLTTATDLARMTRKGLQNPTFRKIVASKSYLRPATNKQEEKLVIQSNRLLKDGKFYYPFAIGVKTGYHKMAKFNLVAAAEKEGRELIAVVLGAEKTEDRFIDAKRLFEAAYKEKPLTQKFFEKEAVFSAKVPGGKIELQAIIKEELEASFYLSEAAPIKALILWNNFSLPIQKDQHVGYVILQKGEEILAKAPLYAKERVRRTIWKYFKDLF